MSVVTFQQNVNGYTGVLDTYLRGGTSATTNFENAGILVAKSATDLSFTRSSLLSFDISSIPAGSTINSAKIDFKLQQNGDKSSTVYLFTLLRTSWVAAQATWNIYKTSNNWTTAGARSDTNDITGTWNNGTGKLSSFPVAGTDLVGDTKTFATSAAFVTAVTNALGGTIHLCMQEANNDTAGGNCFVYDSSDATASNRPILTIDYTSSALSSTLADNITVSDTLLNQIMLGITLLDNTTTSDTLLTTIPTLLKSLADNITASDVESGVIPTLLSLLADQITASDVIVPRIPVLLQAMADNINASDSLTPVLPLLLQTLADTLTVSDTISPLIPTLLQIIVDNISVSDTLNPLIPELIQSLVDAIIASDGLTLDETQPVVDLLISLADSIQASDTLNPLIPELLQSLIDNITVTDTLNPLVPFLVQNLFDAISATDTIDEILPYLTQLLSDNITINDFESGSIPVLYQSLIDNITASDKFSGLIPLLIQLLADGVIVADSISELDFYPPNSTYFVVSSTGPDVLDLYVNNTLVGRMTLA